MPTYHKVRPSDCIFSVAFEYGFFPDTIWNHPENAELKAKRQNPNILMPGDTVFIPDKETKEEERPTDALHQFKLKAVPAKIKFQVLHNEKPVANAKYTLNIDGKVTEGTTDGDGKVEIWIFPNAKKGELKVETEKKEELVYQLDLGGLDPYNIPSGFQARLENLGYSIAPDTLGEVGEGTKAALALFQRDHNLPPTGKPDAATIEKIKSVYGS